MADSLESESLPSEQLWKLIKSFIAPNSKYFIPALETIPTVP